MFCTQCGKEVDYGPGYCPHCGYKVPQPGRKGSSLYDYLLKSGRIAGNGEPLHISTQEDEIEREVITFDDVAGMESLKRTLREIVMLLEGKGPKGLRPWKSLVMFGPPGTGKTYIARALAGELDYYFKVISGGDFKTKWYGESEKRVREIFQEAAESQPAIIFFDEVDSLAAARDREIDAAVLNQILQELDGFSSHDRKILVISATNRPWVIDYAYLSRMERKIYIPLPDLIARQGLYSFYTRDLLLSSDLNIPVLARESENNSAREIERICQDSALNAWRDCSYDINNEYPVETHHFHNAIKNNPPSISKEDIDKFEEWAGRYAVAGSAGKYAGISPGGSYDKAEPLMGKVDSFLISGRILDQIVRDSMDVAPLDTWGILEGRGSDISGIKLIRHIPNWVSDRPLGIASITQPLGISQTFQYCLPEFMRKQAHKEFYNFCQSGAAELKVFCFPAIYRKSDGPSVDEMAGFAGEPWIEDEGILYALRDWNKDGAEITKALQEHLKLIELYLQHTNDKKFIDTLALIKSNLLKVLNEIKPDSHHPITCMAAVTQHGKAISLRLSDREIAVAPERAEKIIKAVYGIHGRSLLGTGGGAWDYLNNMDRYEALISSVSAEIQATSSRDKVGENVKKTGSERIDELMGKVDKRLDSLKDRMDKRLSRFSDKQDKTQPTSNTGRTREPEKVFEPALDSGLLAGPASDLVIGIEPVEWTGLVRAFRSEPIIKALTITNSGYKRYEQLHVSIDLPGLTHSQKVIIPKISAGESVNLSSKDVTPQYDLKAFLKISERINGRITVTISDSKGQALQITNSEIPVLAYNECPVTTAEASLIACFVQPMSQGVIEVTRHATRHLRTLNDTAAFAGYQFDDPVMVDNMVKALYLAVQQDIGVTYINPPPSYEIRERGLQRLRTPDQVILREKLGTCFDLSVLFASLLEHIGLHPVIYIIRGHAFYGYFTRSITLPEPVFMKWGSVAEIINSGELVAINSTTFCEGGSYAQSKQTGNHYLIERTNAADEFQCVIDIQKAREQGFLPMDLDNFEETRK